MRSSLVASRHERTTQAAVRLDGFGGTMRLALCFVFLCSTFFAGHPSRTLVHGGDTTVKIERAGAWEVHTPASPVERIPFYLYHRWYSRGPEIPGSPALGRAPT